MGARSRAPGEWGAHDGRAVSRVPGGSKTGGAGGRSQHFEPERTNLGEEGGSNSNSKVSSGLAKTVPGVETEAREFPGPAQRHSGERREASPPGTWLLSGRGGFSGNSGRGSAPATTR